MSRDGGPAFPIPRVWNQDRSEVSQWEDPGMSLRDYFAGQALIALFSQEANPNGHGWAPGDRNNAAQEAYALADAMLVARER